MDKLFNWTSVAIGFIGGVIANIWGGWDVLLYALVVLIAIDYVTGVIKGLYTKTLSSEIGFKGLCKKIVILLMVAVANVIGNLIGDNNALREIILTFFIANEGISILENAAVVYPNMPAKIKDALLQLRDRGNSDD